MPKITLIQRFDHTCAVVFPDRETMNYKDLDDANQAILKLNLRVGVVHLHPAGVKVENGHG